MDTYLEIADPGSIRPLPDAVHRALPVVAAMGIISLLTTTLLLLRLSYLFVRWRRDGKQGISQVLVLITNLIAADVLQATAFMLNVYWLALDKIDAKSGICWAQGWFVSTGDLSSGVFTLLIAIHAFADVVFGFRLKTRSFMLTITACWILVYACPVVGVAFHQDYFARAGPWCFINGVYGLERLYLHYLWIIVAEFLTVVLYLSIFIVIQRHGKFSHTPETTRARSAAKMMIAYPIAYCICTLPLVSARLVDTAGGHPGYLYLCIGGAMITCNGWVDVLLYTLTRSNYIIQGALPDSEAPVIETFQMPGQSLGYDHNIWKHGGEMLCSRSDVQGWPCVDLTSESERIQERASRSLQMLEAARRADANAQLQNMPRFFERIYHQQQPRSPSHSPSSAYASPWPPSTPLSATFPAEPIELE